MKAKQLSLVAMAAVIPVSSLADSSVNLGYTPGYPGATVPVPVTIRQSQAVAVGAQFEVEFNAGKVSALAALRGEQLTNHVIRSRQVVPGVERVLIYSLAGAAVPGTNVTLARLPFTVSPTEFV